MILLNFFTGVLLLVISLLAVSGLLSTQAATSDAITKGKLSYDFYCYQCHAYDGDAQTLASTYLNPKPRNFASTSHQQLNTEQMVAAITHGREGTAMVSFSSVLSADEIKNVVSYIRQRFMGNNKANYIYHTKANGWPNHQRYQIAFPFASGELALDTPWQQLNESQQKGKTLFMQSCISCHDRAVVNDEGPTWELRPLSYPREHFDNKADVHIISGASPYHVHEKIPDTSNMSAQIQRGNTLFQINCAFCHGGAATGKNWIGRFMEPPARDLTSDEITKRPDGALLQVIRDGLPNTSMPAWKQVLNDEQIKDIISYLKRQQDN